MTTTKRHPRQAQIDLAEARGYDRAAQSPTTTTADDDMANILYPEPTDAILRDAFCKGWKSFK